jgi:hypothetical protein
MSPSKTTGPTPHFEHLKPTKAPALLGFVLFSHAQNMQKRGDL